MAEITFPEKSFPEDITGQGLPVDFLKLEKTLGRKARVYTEIQILQNERSGYLAGTFGQFQCLRRENGIEIAVRFTSDGQGGGRKDDLGGRYVIDPETPVKWVIHPIDE